MSTTPMTSNLELRVIECQHTRRRAHAIVHCRTGLVLVVPTGRYHSPEKLADRYAFFVCWLESQVNLDTEDPKQLHAGLAALNRMARQRIANAAKDPGTACVDCGNNFAMAGRELCTHCAPQPRNTPAHTEQEALTL